MHARNHDAVSYEGERGPSWRDVWVLQRELEELTAYKIAFVCTTNMAVDKTWGLYVQLSFDGKLFKSFGAGWGKGYENCARTMPAAVYVLMTKVYHFLEEMSPLVRLEWLSDTLKRQES